MAQHRSSFAPVLPLALLVSLALVTCPPAQADNVCDEPGDQPDLVLSSLDSASQIGSLGETSSYSFGSTSCNFGTCGVEWVQATPAHPVFTQNFFRLRGGRFEQIGLGWAAHRFLALSNPACSTECQPTGGTMLGVDCSSSNSAQINAAQQYLGPRSDVNASTGAFVFPFVGFGQTGDLLFRRLQVRHRDLDPAIHPDSSYFAEGLTLAADDAAAGNAGNNAIYREVLIAPDFSVAFASPSVPRRPAIRAWAAADPTVNITEVVVPGDGRFLVGSKVVTLNEGLWRYEYAVYNFDSHRSAGRFSVPLPVGATVTAAGFHDVEYHSGESYDGQDWDVSVDPAAGLVTWSTQDFAENADANAVRWGTLYNFRFESDAAPTTAIAELGLFRPGGPDAAQIPALVPAVCNDDAICDADETICGCPMDCGSSPSSEQQCQDGSDDDCDGLVDCDDPDCCTSVCGSEDNDGDGVARCQDCNDDNPAAWALPGDAAALLYTRDANGLRIDWDPPQSVGADSVRYELLQTESPADFLAGRCVELEDPGATSHIDSDLPVPGELVFVLVRPVNDCPGGAGSIGKNSAEQTRRGRLCS